MRPKSWLNKKVNLFTLSYTLWHVNKFIINELLLHVCITYTRVPINAQVCVLYAQKMKRTHSFFIKGIIGMQEKSSKNFSNRQRTPEMQREPPTLWNWESKRPLTIKTSGNSAYSSLISKYGGYMHIHVIQYMALHAVAVNCHKALCESSQNTPFNKVLHGRQVVSPNHVLTNISSSPLKWEGTKGTTCDLSVFTLHHKDREIWGLRPWEKGSPLYGLYRL